MISAGAPLFADTLAGQGVAVERVDWRPPAAGDAALAGMLARTWDPSIDRANEVALRRVLEAQQVLVDVLPAGEVVPGMQRDTILHAGPPITWERMSGPVRGAMIGALLYERRASTAEAAERLAASGTMTLDPCHHHAAVGPMAGIITASMPVLIVENRAHGNRAYSGVSLHIRKTLVDGGPEFTHPEFDMETRIVQSAVVAPRGHRDVEDEWQGRSVVRRRQRRNRKRRLAARVEAGERPPDDRGVHVTARDLTAR